MNRRHFLQSVSLITLGVYLRLAPEKTKAVPVVDEQKNTATAGCDDGIWEFDFSDGLVGQRGRAQFIFRPNELPLYLEVYRE